jgi:polyketide synthase PksN
MEISPQDATLFGFSGMSALTEDEGIEAFERLLRGETSQVLVAVGDAAKIARTLRVHGAASLPVETASAGTPASTAAASSRAVAAAPRVTAVKTAPVPAPRVAHERDAVAAAPGNTSSNTAADLQRRTEHYLKERLGVVVKMAATDIGAQTTFEQLGMDSVMLMELRDGLSKDFTGLPKTVLFEYDTPLRLAQYLMQQHADALRARLGSAEPAVADAAPPASSTKAAPVAVSPPAVSTSRTAASATASTALPVSGKRRLATSLPPPVADNAVAVIGLAGQFPGAADLAEFWSNLQQARDCLSPIPAERWTMPAATALAGTRDGRRSYFSKGGFLSDVDQFDPALFRMSPTEAAKLDPQLRVLLRAAWHAVEDAAYTPEALSPERVGVYVGAMNEDFTWIMSELYARTGEYPGPGSVVSELANRISFLMNFRGPSLTVSTACSSSLTAIHLARQSILSGESDVALAGGVNLSLHPSKYLMLQDMKVLSPDGQERTFDEAANGLVPSEGVGMVMLKRLSRALADGDQIYGVIRGSSISHAGTGAGQYLPNLKMLEDTVARSLRESGLQADELSYIESHGTGTELGDPIELKALANALRQSTASERFCAIGTKANLGHMEAASGVCSLIKVLLSMKHGRLSPCAKLNAVNSSFEHEFSPFHFPREAQPWQANARGTRAAGINSFGMGGSNAFMVLESLLPETSLRSQPVAQAEPSIVVLSAKSEERLRAYTAALVGFLEHAEREAWSAADFADLAYSSQVGRIAFEHRLAIVASDRKEFIAKAGKYLQAGAVADLGIFGGHGRSQDGLPDLLDGDAGKDFIDALLQSRQWDKLASIWTRGCVIDWSRVHAGARRRVPFPAYPFDTLRCDLHEAIGMQAPRLGAGAAVEAVEQAVSAEAPQVGHEWFHLDASSAELTQAGDDTEGDGDELAKQYWLDHLRGFADTSFLLAPVLLPEYAEESGEPENHAELPAHSVTDSLGETLTQSLQRCTQVHRIEVETLIAAAWAILVNRYTKARCAQFGILKSFTPTQRAAMAEAAPGDDAIRNLVPVRVCTVGKEKVAGWLTGLQRKLNHKLAYAHVPIQRIESWIGVENLFDSVIAFENSGQPQAAAQPSTDDTRPLLASEVFSPQSRVAMELVVTIHDDAVDLNLIYRSAEAEDEKIRTLLEHFQVLLEGLAEHPEKNPAALAMRTKRESRETFWKTLDKVNQ